MQNKSLRFNREQNVSFDLGSMVLNASKTLFDVMTVHELHRRNVRMFIFEQNSLIRGDNHESKEINHFLSFYCLAIVLPSLLYGC